MLELAILGLLKEQELHGYELKKRLSEMLGLASGVSFGSLYPALARLEAAGAVKAVEAQAEPADRSLISRPVPMTGSIAGELALLRARRPPARGRRGKKVYGLTGHGEELFEELLAGDSGGGDDDRTFSLRLAFARYLLPDARLAFLERRRTHLIERVGRLQTRADAARSGDPYASSLVEHDIETARHDLTWIERLIAHERDLRADRAPAGHRRAPESVHRHGPERSSTRRRTTRRKPDPSSPTTPTRATSPADAAATGSTSHNGVDPVHRAQSPTISALRRPTNQEDIVP